MRGLSPVRHQRALLCLAATVAVSCAHDAPPLTTWATAPVPSGAQLVFELSSPPPPPLTFDMASVVGIGHQYCMPVAASCHGTFSISGRQFGPNIYLTLIY